MTEDLLAKIILVGPYHYLKSIVVEVEKASNPKLALFAQYSHIQEVVIYFDRDPELAAFIREVGFNAPFMNLFRDVSDMMQGFNREKEL